MRLEETLLRRVKGYKGQDMGRAMRYIPEHMRSGLVRAVRLLALFIFALTMVYLLTEPASAAADGGSVVAQQSPYELPQTEIDLLGWGAGLPLWAQAALVSAVGVGAFFFVPTVARRIWGMFVGPDGGGS